MKNIIRIAVLAIIAGLLVILGSTGNPASACRPAKTQIISVTGNHDKGYRVTYSGCTGHTYAYPPVRKAIKKCNKRDYRWQRQRCKGSVRTEYKYLWLFRNSLT